MKINELEISVLRQHFKNLGIKIKDNILETLKVEDRSFSGAGFMTDLMEDTNLRVFASHISSADGEVGAILNSEVESGYLFYVEGGYLKSIEGYTYAQPWPEEISKIEVYKQLRNS